ncbi:MAG TPA: acyltransferase [Pseudonocardiaceae bacterium]|jgi:peptidoglycan/LPS O-acetylase OafA/YrhL|nr:acyltransferase [Pseudonocardiaceae bacterium]
MTDDLAVSANSENSANSETARPSVDPTRRRFVFLDVFRAIAVCLVVYSHVVGVWAHQHDDTSGLASALQGFVPHPLALTLNIGDFGVVLFFLVSGFIVTHTGFTETPRQYATKRFLRIYPMLLVAVLLAAVLFLVHLHPLTTGDATTVTPLTVLTNASLANYLLSPTVVLVDVGWTLVIEVLFYLLLLLALPLLRRVVWPVIIGELGLVAVVLATARWAGSSYFLFAVSVSYLPALLLGQVVWATWSRRVPLWAGGALAVLAWLEYVWAGMPSLGREDSVYDYNLNLAIGLALFVLALLAERRLRPVRVITYLADRSYSLYLLHGLLAISVMNLLYGHLGYPAALLCGLAVTAAGIEAGYRWVERPSMRLARRLARRWKPG